MADLRTHVRPDGRCLVWPDGQWTADQAHVAAVLAAARRTSLLTTIDAGSTDELVALERAGFKQARYENVVEADLTTAINALAGTALPDGIIGRSAADVDVDDLRRLDDELRDDVPGTSGWRSSPAEFQEDTFDDRAYNPKTYLVAMPEARGELIGLVRVWMNEPGPRIGMIGVTSRHRGRGIASALLAQVLREVQALGACHARSEYDVTNLASAAIFAKVGARSVGSRIEYELSPDR
ncbi:MAG: GNAT family N-acetyltransferase [Candidatus Limnocylindria bacterium]